MKRRAVVSWSSGKDSAWCLHLLRSDPDVEVVGLLTSVTPEFGRVSVHGTRRSVLRAQADGLGLPLHEVEIPHPCSNEEYEAAMRSTLREMAGGGGGPHPLAGACAATHVAFGDLFLADIRAYREALLEGSGVEPLFPLWGQDTGALAAEMEEGGIEAVIVAAPESSPVAELVRTRWSSEALARFDGVDPCGERGEFHTCVVAAPGLPRLEVEVGRVVRRDGSVYADLALAGSGNTVPQGGP